MYIAQPKFFPWPDGAFPIKRGKGRIKMCIFPPIVLTGDKYWRGFAVQVFGGLSCDHVCSAASTASACAMHARQTRSLGKLLALQPHSAECVSPLGQNESRLIQSKGYPWGENGDVLHPMG